MADTITIDHRFNGPPESGNGGYTCGRLAQYVDGPAEVTLRLPPPLGRPLRVERGGDGGATLYDGDALVAEARPIDDLTLEPPAPIAAAEAEEAAARSTFLDEHTHPFPTCFVCGPLRAEHDGLRIFPGPAPGRDGVFAARWTPDADPVTPELAWAALDCPSSAPIWNGPTASDFRPVVLARLAAKIEGEPQPGEPHTILAWAIGVDGRKRHSAAALYSASGEPLAVARALWIELRPTS